MVIEIEKKAYDKVYRFAKKLGDKEIGGLLLGDVDKDGKMTVNDAILFEQQVGWGSILISDKALMDFTKNASAKKLKSVIGWWHSHGNGAAFWSITDDECFKRLTNFSGLCFGMVVSNTLKHNKAYRIDIKTPQWGVISLDELNVEVESKSFWKGNRLSKQEKKEIEKKVTDAPQKYEYYGGDDYFEGVSVIPKGMNTNDIFNDNSSSIICPKCKGVGAIYYGNIPMECGICNGRGHVLKKELEKEEEEEDAINYIG